ncbi:MAG: YggS family pyridoxal phosphate-dependent enzyme [Kangiellaceae bacterium]|nr:YggS family pyridoxal phosphate-dependent enzyme [Kangiellaceae bacterium]
MNIANRIASIHTEIEQCCCKYHININELKLLAVSKTHPASAIQAAYDAGFTEFGESYLQEALEKVRSLRNLSIIWHFIGPIQSNKTRDIAANFDWVQSVDRARILERLNQQRPAHLPKINICLQVNYFAESQKKGVSVEELPELLELAHQLPNIRLRGLMAIPPKTDCFETQMNQYRQIAECYNHYRQRYSFMDTLSMGMSNDLSAAIANGSSMVRIGTALFGKRQ